MELVLKIYCSIFGLLFGSLANVLILRIPKNEDVVLKSSHCPKCQGKIKWYMNIPLLSFLFLKGKCFYCSKKISWQYPLVEFSMGLVGFYLAPQYFSFENSFLFLFYFFTAFGFIIHFIVDIRHQILPDSINLFLLLTALLYSILTKDWKFYTYGFVIGFGGTYFITWAFFKLKGQIGLGGGDIKLFGVLGILLGPFGITQNIFVSCFLGSLIGVVLIIFKKMGKQTPMPFGPFILLTASWQLFFPESFNYALGLVFSN